MPGCLPGVRLRKWYPNNWHDWNRGSKINRYGFKYLTILWLMTFQHVFLALNCWQETLNRSSSRIVKTKKSFIFIATLRAVSISTRKRFKKGFERTPVSGTVNVKTSIVFVKISSFPRDCYTSPRPRRRMCVCFFSLVIHTHAHQKKLKSIAAELATTAARQTTTASGHGGGRCTSLLKIRSPSVVKFFFFFFPRIV